MARGGTRGCKQLDGRWWLGLARERMPVLKFLSTYSSNDFISDLIAGVTVGLTVMPQGLAYATLAGLEPQVRTKFHMSFSRFTINVFFSTVCTRPSSVVSSTRFSEAVEI